jgi:hypothetical protein
VYRQANLVLYDRVRFGLRDLLKIPVLALATWLSVTGVALSAQETVDTQQDPASQPAVPSTPQNLTPQPGQIPAKTQEQIAAEQIKKQEHQRVLGIIPIFNMSNIPDAVAMTPTQKFQLAFRGAIDPVTFLIAGADAGISHAQNDYKGYGQGAEGYFKRWGASYADSFDGAMLGNALFPTLLHQDPRYFRKGTGSFKSRLWYAMLATVRCKGDNRKWQPNFSNVLGNIAAGGIANLYYPSTDRGVGLTFERAFTVTAEGAIGSVFLEFWPDISHHFQNKH